MTPAEYCQQQAVQSGSSFYYSFLFLPPDKRRAITALYAFCRDVDDIVDECSDPAVARLKLAWWRNEVAAIRTGAAQHPVARALAELNGTFNLPAGRLNEIIDGMDMDLARNRYDDFAALEVYCHRVAGVVGVLSAEIFGYRDKHTLDYAHELGVAFQLTNIIRDVGEDARRNRIYLPLDELKRFGVAIDDVLNARHTDNFGELMKFQIARARERYRQALRQLPDVDRKSQRTGLIMAAIYQATLDEIEADGCRVLQGRIALTPLRKLWIAWKTWISQ